MRSLLIAVAIAVACAASESVTRYDGFKVFRLTPETEKQVQLLTLLQNANSNLDFWDGVGGVGKTTDIMVSSEGLADFILMLETSGMKMEVFMDDVQKNIDLGGTPVPYSKGQKAAMNWTEYYQLGGIYEWLNDLVVANPSVASTIDLGLSYEGRQIKALKLTFGTGRRVVYVEGGIHAREWISPATTTYLINELLYSQDAAIREIAQSYDWYIVPVANPDGYEFTYNQTRLWRKTRTPYPLCSGADMNRNWDVFWGTEGTSTLTCSETYGGPNAFSEKETVVLSEFIKTFGTQLDVFLSFHSYGHKMLMPYGHTLDHLDNYDDVFKVGQAAIKALAVRYNTQYDVGNTAEAVYKHSGGTMDWVKKTFQVPIAFTYELRDTGATGFVLPPSQIIPNCLEVMDSIVALFNEGKNLGLITPS